MNPWLWIALGGAAGIIALLIGLIVYMLLRRRDTASLHQSPWAGELTGRSAGRIQRDLSSLAGDLQRLTDDVDRRLESKMDELRLLLARAEAACDRLARATGTDRPAPTDARGDSAPPRNQQPCGAYARAQADACTPHPADDDDADEPDTEDNALRREVVRLAEQGLTPEDIARRTALPVGQVSLMINLHACQANPAE